MKTEITEDGRITVSTGESTWTCNSPDQAAKHLATWTDQKRNVVPSEVIEAGDVSAIRDCHNDAQKQVAETGRYRPTAKWIYKNDGNVIQVTQVIGTSGALAVVDSTDAPADASAPTEEDLAANEPSLLGKLWRFFGFTQ